jgi:hypothetical protein
MKGRGNKIIFVHPHPPLPYEGGGYKQQGEDACGIFLKN